MGLQFQWQFRAWGTEDWTGLFQPLVRCLVYLIVACSIPFNSIEFLACLRKAKNFPLFTFLRSNSVRASYKLGDLFTTSARLAAAEKSRGPSTTARLMRQATQPVLRVGMTASAPAPLGGRGQGGAITLLLDLNPDSND